VGNARSQRRALEKAKNKNPTARADDPQAPAARPGPGQLPLQYEERVETFERYSGPIPQASEIRQYEEVLPGLADRIVTMAEKQAKHRRRMETMDVFFEHLHVTAGQASALIVALFFGWIAWDLGQDGHEVLAAFIGGVDLVALVSVFIYGKRKEAQQQPPA
jgi:uncharacterized membrane protein